MDVTTDDTEVASYLRGQFADERDRSRKLTNELIKQRNLEVKSLAGQLATILNRLDELEVGVEVNGEVLTYDESNHADVDVVDLTWHVGPITGVWEVSKHHGGSWTVR